MPTPTEPTSDGEAPEATRDAVVEVDSAGLVVGVNEQAEALFGYPREQMLGRSVECLVGRSVLSSVPDYRARYLAAPAAWPTRAALDCRRRDGSEFPAEVSVCRDPSGSGASVAAVIREVSGRRSAEQATRAKGEFLSRMSHELRTPLNAILGFAQLLELDSLSPDQLDSVHHILGGGNRLLTLVDEILDISRIEAGRSNLSLEPVRVGEVVGEALRLVAPLATDWRVALEVDPGASPDTLTMADRHRLRQVLLNLASNAVRYNRPEGRVAISWSVDDGRVRIRVADTGVGIRPEEMGRLFAPFERLAAQETDLEGAGLGLALCRNLVVGMGGRIWAESEPQLGSTFWVELGHAHGRAARSNGRPAASAPPVDTPRPRILHVDENPTSLELVERMLTRRYAVEMIPTLQGSLTCILARRHQPDVILLDLSLPDVLAEEVLDLLQADPSTSRIPVILLAETDVRPRRLSRLMRSGAFAHVTRPINVSRFLDLVDEALHRSLSSPDLGG